ncbi:MAG: NAD(P)/FAD-dependent oxidoreductase [Bacteroidetes bacterium]|nr:NAD(P)/FAD-dependent oxidoreductase [Bacteroidota bacterium]
MDPKRVIVIGGGAAGFFSAINVAFMRPGTRITILEKTNKLLSKVKVSGGGRCNVTHHCFENSELVKNYPRGNKELLQVFSKFNVANTIEWFEKQGVKLKVEEDGRMFPVTDDSQTIVDCFQKLAAQFRIEVITQCEVFSIKKYDGEFRLKTNKAEFSADAVVCSIGGHNKSDAYHLIKNLGHTIVDPVPSLFTLNLPNESIKKELQGVSVKLAEVRIAGSKLNYSGPVLITHWGLSGPAVLKLSAFAAHDFFKAGYIASILVNWVHPFKAHEVVEKLKQFQKEKHKALPYTAPCFDLPRRLWEFLCERSGIDNKKPWAELNKKELNALAENLCNAVFKMEGKTTFKEEFVSCGGVHLKEVDFKTMQSKLVPGLYFCGEVLNIDGITGGFNFQNAWSTAWISANAIASTPDS